MLFNIFKINKALKQATRYVDEVNEINMELRKIIEQQNEIIEKQQNEIESYENAFNLMSE